MKNNNTLWKLVTIAITLIVVIGGIIYGYATLESQVAGNTQMKPEIELNTEHRHRFEEKVENIERDIALILKAVEK